MARPIVFGFVRPLSAISLLTGTAWFALPACGSDGTSADSAAVKPSGAAGALGAGSGANSSAGAATTGKAGSSAGGRSQTTDGASGGGASASGGRSAGGTSGAVAGSGNGGERASTGGAPSSTGATSCGKADEGQSVNLACPDGQVIDAVTFASYGTPTGDCGSFATGACNAATSASVVSSLCVGRRSCSVASGNGSFGDPCHSTTKHLAVEVSCVVGDPTVQPSTPYKGVANSPAAQLKEVGATWCYNWGTTPKSSDCDDPLFVPMVWGSGGVAAAIQQIGEKGYKTVLGFNEPNKSDQSNLTVDDAIAMWPDLTSDPNIRVGSPAVSDDGRAWLEQFMTQVKAKGLRVDFIAMHWYGWNAGSCKASQLEGAVTWASQWGLPVWITEFGCMGSSNPDEQTVLSFFKDALPMLAGHPLVERYAWYPWNTYNEIYDDQGVQTALGAALEAAPQYRP